MNTQWSLLFLALSGGMAAGFQGPLSGILGRHVGVMGSVFIVHLGGMLGSALLLWWPGLAHLDRMRSAPWYALSAGLLGIVLVGAFSACVPRLGAATTITVVVLGQLTIAMVLDHFGVLVEDVRLIDPSRLLGLGLVMLGTWFVVR